MSPNVVISSVSSFLRKSFQETEQELKGSSDGKAVGVFQAMVKRVEAGLQNLQSDVERGCRDRCEKGT